MRAGARWHSAWRPPGSSLWETRPAGHACAQPAAPDTRPPPSRLTDPACAGRPSAHGRPPSPAPGPLQHENTELCTESCARARACLPGPGRAAPPLEPGQEIGALQQAAVECGRARAAAQALRQHGRQRRARQRVQERRVAERRQVRRAVCAAGPGASGCAKSWGGGVTAHDLQRTSDARCRWLPAGVVKERGCQRRSGPSRCCKTGLPCWRVYAEPTGAGAVEGRRVTDLRWQSFIR